MSSIYISIVTRFSAICLKPYYLYTDIEKSDSMHTGEFKRDYNFRQTKCYSCPIVV